jgi:dihydrofolate reductase
MKSIVVAYDQAHGIGADNDLLWQRNLPADLAHVKRITTGGSVVMGRRTFESIGRPLPNRENIVITSTPTGVVGVLSAASLESAYDLARYPIFVIGGGTVYHQVLEDEAIDRVYATEVQATFPQATVFFPELPADKWRETARESHAADEANAYAYDFVTYDRITPQSAL